MKAERLFDCAQVLILPDGAEAEKAVQIIRSKQFWHVVISGKYAFRLSRVLRESPGMPNFLVEEDGCAEAVKEMLAMRNVQPKTLAVTQDVVQTYRETFPQATIFVISV